jgi:hypothetical protein
MALLKKYANVALLGILVPGESPKPALTRCDPGGLWQQRLVPKF